MGFNYKYHFILFLLLISNKIIAQSSDYWQQKAEYKINCEVDKNIIQGKEIVRYFNNSPDTLHKLYFHLYFNAFQKESMMSIRAQTVLDPERNMDDKFSKLKKKDSGNVEILSCDQNGQSLKFEVIETILKIELNQPILPHDSTDIALTFKSQIPKLIRRAGLDSEEGIDYNMAQWYPKVVEYDREGFHPDFYLGREFYGVWGDYDVEILIDKSYIVAAGCESMESMDVGNKIKWHFISKNVHDFAWAADRDYTHYELQADSLTTFHFYYQNKGKRIESWPELGEIMKDAFIFMNKRYGRYQYPTYTFIEAGDGGMEYPLATFITGNRSLNSLTGICIHEFMHSWYQMQLATNENLYHWMDEGFTSFATIEVMEYLISRGKLDRSFPDFPFENDYKNYNKYLNSGIVEPMNVPADKFATNLAYNMCAYNGGLVFLKQLEYIVGKEAFDKGLLIYFDKWKFKHPTPNDFIRIMEKISGLELHWYLQYFVNGVYYVDYTIESVKSDKDKSIITLKRDGDFPMPIDLVITFVDGESSTYNIPLKMMLGHKGKDLTDLTFINSWAWVDYEYSFEIPLNGNRIKSIEIDPSQRLFDIDREGNIWENDN